MCRGQSSRRSEDKRPDCLLAGLTDGAVNQSAVRSIRIEFSEPISAPKGVRYSFHLVRRNRRYLGPVAVLRLNLLILCFLIARMVSLPAAMADLRGTNPIRDHSGFRPGLLDSGVVSEEFRR